MVVSSVRHVTDIIAEIGAAKAKNKAVNGIGNVNLAIIGNGWYDATKCGFG